MSSSSISTNGDQIGFVWYTGKTQNATAASRTAIDVSILPGYVLCADTYNHDGDGLANYTRPATAILNARKCVVLEVPSTVNDTVSSATRRGGKVKVAWVMDRMPTEGLFVEGTTNIVIHDNVGVTDGQFYAVKKSALDATCIAVAGEGFATDATGRVTKGTIKSAT